MPLKFDRAVEAIVPLVRSAEVAARWDEESALPGLTVGALTRHLVSQPECAAEFLAIEFPTDRVRVLSLIEYADQLDWLDAPADAPENTSIRDEFNAMSRAGVEESVAALDAALAALASRSASGCRRPRSRPRRRAGGRAARRARVAAARADRRGARAGEVRARTGTDLSVLRRCVTSSKHRAATVRPWRNPAFRPGDVRVKRAG